MNNSQEKTAQLQNIINAIPGGVAIYKVSDIFETVYYSDGVPALSGYTPAEYAELVKQDAVNMTYPEDTAMVVSKIRTALADDTAVSFEFRKQHRDGHIVWVNVYAKKIGETDGCPLLQCVFHNITAFKETQLQLDHVVNSVPGGIATYDLTNIQTPRRLFCSDGVATLLGCKNKEELDEYCPNPWDVLFKDDVQRVSDAFKNLLNNGTPMNISFRVNKKNLTLNWVHLNGRIVDKTFYAVLSGMSEEARLFQQITNETAQGIYVVACDSYKLLYYNETTKLFLQKSSNALGEKCYVALHKQTQPCSWCPLPVRSSTLLTHEVALPDGRSCEIRTKNIDWQGIPSYLLYVNDITSQMTVSHTTKKLEQFYQTLIRNLPGGIAVLSYDRQTGRMLPEFISEGFAELSGMTLQQVYDVYSNDATAGVHPEDVGYAINRLREHLNNNLDTCETIYRLRKGDGSYIWVKNNSSLIMSSNGKPLIYAFYNDVTKEITERQKLRQKYNDILFRQQHYPLENEIISGYCNITKDEIIRIYDKTDSELLEIFGSKRRDFFKGMASLIENPAEQELFLSKFMNEPLQKAFLQGITRHETECFVRLPKDKSGHYLKCTINLIEAPDSGDVIGILSVIDTTETRISDVVSMRLTHIHYDFIAIVDFEKDHYKLLFRNDKIYAIPPLQGSYRQSTGKFVTQFVVPKDREFCEKMFSPEYIRTHLSSNNSFSFNYSIADAAGNLYMKNMIIYQIDKRLHKYGLACSDVTESVREQRVLLNSLAYTFEQLSIINLITRDFTMHTRESVLQNLPPYKAADFEDALTNLELPYHKNGSLQPRIEDFAISVILQKLNQQPKGYEFILPYYEKNGSQYHKQINVLWGDDDHHTICLVRCDVTDIITAEQKSREILQNTLKLAQEANQAKSDFLSSMSHDIRTPMNAIIGMTDLALENVGTQMPTSEYLQIIKSSSMHLLTLINDILDMSRIEKGKLIIEHRPFNLALEIDRFCSRNQVLMNKKQLQFRHSTKLQHENVLGDVLHLQRIWDNIISNAIKFTPEGGTVSFEVCELPPKNSHIGYYQFVISDTGIGIDKNSLSQLFDPFYRSNEVVSNHIEGSGLGLAIVKNIVDYKGGTIKVESTPGQGTSFIITLPLHFDTSPASGTLTSAVKAASTAADFDFSGKHILLVEDHPINQQVAELVLQKTGAQITIANNGAEGSEMFEASIPGSFDAILMDIQMPVMNGYEATKVIRSSTHPQSATIPIIAMTANAFAEDIKNALSAGMNAHIAKPIDPQKLYETLAAYIK